MSQQLKAALNKLTKRVEALEAKSSQRKVRPTAAAKALALADKDKAMASPKKKVAKPKAKAKPKGKRVTH